MSYCLQLWEGLNVAILWDVASLYFISLHQRHYPAKQFKQYLTTEKPDESIL